MAKTDAQRGAVATWARRERLARGWSTQDVVNELARRGVHITELSYRGYEAGPRVSAPVRRGLEAVYGSSAPDATKEAAEPQQLDDLIAALDRQTEAIHALATSLRESHRTDEDLTRLVSASLTTLLPQLLAALRGDQPVDVGP